MLSESSYHIALYCYTGAALLMVLYLAFWLGRHWSAGWASLAVLLAAALLLTPAYPGVDVDTMAPAVVVAVFQLLTEGLEAAGHTLKILGITCGAAVVLALLLRLLVFRPRGGAKGEAALESGE